MCGIVGVALKSTTGFSFKTQGAFYELLYVDALRGFDSTGVIGVECDSQFHIMKGAMSAGPFLSQLKVHNLDKKMWNQGKVMIGHNRKATVGLVGDETAHPFVVDKTLALVHNGTLHNHHRLANTKVDSEALAIHLKKAIDTDTTEALETALGEVYGAYAVAAYDQKKHRVLLLRNKDRPLSIIETDDAWYWASELPMLQFVLWRAGYTEKGCKVIEVPEHTLFTIELQEKKLSQVQLVPKKDTPPKSQHQAGSTGSSEGMQTASNKAVPVTEKMFKRLRQRHLGKSVKFWCNEFIELDYPNSIAKGSTQVCLFGQQKQAQFRHSITADVDLSTMSFNGKAEEIVNREWIGKIESMSYQEQGQFVTVNLVDCKPTLTIVKASPSITEKEQYKIQLEAMRDNDLLKLSMDVKGQLKTWQLDCVRDELAIRAGVTERIEHEGSVTFH